jgi:putative hydrolase of the HAD superfamily
MKNYKHIFFDLDHTLWDFNANAEESLKELYEIFELEKLKIKPFEKFYKNYLHHNELLWDRYHKGFISADELKWKRMWRTLLDFKIGDVKLAENMSERFLEILPNKTKLFPYTHEILVYLKNKNYQLHLITNGFEQTQWTKINNSNLSQYFSKVITSEASQSVKPNKEIFEYALLKTGALLEESIMIGDNLDADILGAINAGMDSVFMNHINAEPRLKPTYIIHHLKDLETIL